MRRIEIDVPSAAFEPVVVDPGLYLQQPYRPDTVIDGWTTGQIVVRAASVRGDDHRFSGAPRQDDVALGLHPPTGSVVIAVADGVSAAHQSHHGAAAVCRYTIAEALRQLDTLGQVDWVTVMRGAAWSLVELVKRLSGDPQCGGVEAEQQCATTLAVAVVSPVSEGCLAVHGASVGDSGLGVISGHQFIDRIGSKFAGQDPDLASSAVTPLPRVPELLAERTWNVRSGEVFIVATDGIWDPLGSGRGLLGQLLADQLIHGPPHQSQFARIVDFSRETFDDDRTLVAVWPTEAQAGVVDG